MTEPDRDRLGLGPLAAGFTFAMLALVAVAIAGVAIAGVLDYLSNFVP